MSAPLCSCDYLGGCGDPECCGGPWQVQCAACNNDWEFGDEDEADDSPSNAVGKADVR